MFDGEEIQDLVENEKVEEDKVVQNEEKTENKKSDTVSPTEYVPLANQCDDLVVNSDAQFIDELGILMTKHETSKYLTPFMSQMRKTQEKARRNIKRRIDEKKKLQQPGKGGLILESIFKSYDLQKNRKKLLSINFSHYFKKDRYFGLFFVGDGKKICSEI